MTMQPIQRLCEIEDVVIASGQSLSAVLKLNGRVMVGVYMPSTWTAAGLTFQGSPDGDTYYNIYSATAEVSATAIASVFVALDPMNFFGCNFVKIRSGTAGVPVNQAADRTLKVSAGRHNASR